ncbi:MAG: hypothetical protein ACYDGL_00745 [Bellilinea sp.]
MPVGIDQKRVKVTFSILKSTEEMITQMAIKTFRSKANVIDLAVGNLHAEIVGTGSDEPASPSDQPEPMITK